MILFLGVLWYLLRKPVAGAFAERREKIENELREAAARREKADRLAEDIQARLSQIEGEVSSILDRAREEGDRQKQEIITAARQESEKILASAGNQIDQKVEQARRELTEYAGELAMTRARQIVENSLTDSDRQKLFQESLVELGGTGR